MAAPGVSPKSDLGSDLGSDPDPDVQVRRAAQVLETEIAGLQALRSALVGDAAATFTACLDQLAASRGRIIVSGMGKSGHVARKIAATFASTGTPALYLHPAEASHGDLGMITGEDAILALSKSGETAELGDLLGYARRFSIPLVGITAGRASALAKAADCSFILPPLTEACDQTHAPTTSTTAMMALGDAFAVSMMRRKGITTTRFHDYHPGGSLGAALRRVETLMHPVGGVPDFPLCPEHEALGRAIDILDRGGFGCVGLCDDDGHLTGILTDGDVRRLFGHKPGHTPAHAVMTKTPKTVTAQTLAGEALALMSADKITSLFVVHEGKPIGLLHIHDCLSAGVV
ncbi:MAG: KpsF/GutQ family sugar-phosphate isomerase [Pseudomonadota bacterium]